MLALAWLFYHSVFAIPFLIPVCCVFYRWRKTKRREQERRKLRKEFKEFLVYLSSSVMAGKSVENSIKEIHQEFLSLYGEESAVTTELALMQKKLQYDRQMDELFYQWGERTQIQEIALFAEIFQTAKMNGGNLVRIIKITADSIQEMMELREETETYIHGKRVEQNIMQIMPLAMLLYLNVSSPGFFDGIYGSLFGVIFMSICLTVYLAAVYLADRMITSALEQ